MMFLTLNGVLKALLMVVGGALTLGTTKSIDPSSDAPTRARGVVVTAGVAATAEPPHVPAAAVPAVVPAAPAAVETALDPLAALAFRVLPPEPTPIARRPAPSFAFAARLRSAAALNRPRRSGGQRRTPASRRPRSARDGLLRAAATKPRPKAARRRG